MSDNLYDIGKAIPDALVDLRYGGLNNVLGRQLYVSQKALMRKDALGALVKAAQELREQGLQMVIWDAYRPVDIQKLLRDFCSDSRYVSEVSNHNRGITADVTLSKNGILLDMGTDFDDFSEKSHANSGSITKLQQNNRLVLRNAMTATGFTQLPFEWWHYDYLSEPTPAVIESYGDPRAV